MELISQSQGCDECGPKPIFPLYFLRNFLTNPDDHSTEQVMWRWAYHHPLLPEQRCTALHFLQSLILSHSEYLSFLFRVEHFIRGSAGPLVPAESSFPSFPVCEMSPLACPHLHLSRTPTGDTFLLPITSRLDKAVARGALTNKARFGDRGPWCIFLFIPMHAHSRVCYNDSRGLEGTFHKD